MIFPPSGDILQPVKKEIFIFIVTVGALLSPFAFSQTSDSSAPDPLEAFLNEDEESESNQTPVEGFQSYLNSIILERQAFQQALFSMSQFLQDIEDDKVRRSDVNRMKKQLSEASDLLSENELALSVKGDDIFESLEQCLEPAPKEASSQ